MIVCVEWRVCTFARSLKYEYQVVKAMMHACRQHIWKTIRSLVMTYIVLLGITVRLGPVVPLLRTCIHT